MLYSRYRSGVLALIIMGNVPLALIGSVAALWIAGQPFSVASAIGFITLAGIATRNGILKISHYINLVLFEGESFGRQLVMRGTLERLTPVLMTALAAGIALVPLMIGADEPGKEILHPVAVTIFGGLVSATLLDAFLTPDAVPAAWTQTPRAAPSGGARDRRSRGLLGGSGLQCAARAPINALIPGAKPTSAGAARRSSPAHRMSVPRFARPGQKIGPQTAAF